MQIDHRPLVFLEASSKHNHKLAQSWAYLKEFNYTIEYIPGKVNAVSYYLSRLTTREGQQLEASLEFAKMIQAFNSI